MTSLPVLFGYHASNIGNSHVPLSLCRFWHESGRSVTLMVPSSDDAIDYPWLKPAMRGLKKSLVYRLGKKKQPRNLTEQIFFKTQSDVPLVYLWAGLSLHIFEQFHQIGARIIIERINCHRQTSRSILEKAATEWSLAAPTSITDADIDEENRKLAIADAVFCPSPMVRLSMLENRVAEEKLLTTSYGWSPERFPNMEREQRKNPKPVFLFAGTICLRKGIPLLLEAWKLARLDAELVLCGSIAPEIRDYVAQHLDGNSIRHVAYTRDIGQLYRSADIFVFPSLEEGGPMVTYEAMAHGLPPLVTAMGGGAIVQHGLNGMVLPDMDTEAWASAMTSMAENLTETMLLGTHARQRAQQFTWKNVAQQRAELLEQRYPELWNTGCR
jgi:glycosyltransferase involved in cell wall biosynthesis